MAEPSKSPSNSPDEPPGGRRKGRGNPGGVPENLVPGIKPGQRRGPGGKLLPKIADSGAATPIEAVLSVEVEDELDAMAWVWNNPADRSYQHRSFRAMKDSGPTGFFDRMQVLRKARDEAAQRAEAGNSTHGSINGPAYDGTGPCPTCGREDEKPLEDPTTDQIVKMIDGLVARSREDRENAEAGLAAGRDR